LKIAFTAALSKLGAVEAIPDMLALLHETQDHYLRLEVALALGSLVGEEVSFVRLLRSVRQDLGTTASQSLIEINRRLESPEWAELHQALNRSIEAFSRNELDQGMNTLADSVLALEMEPFPKPVAQVLQASAGELNTSGSDRVDYLVLLLHTLSHHLGVVN
jgi:hypothetical protein